MHIETLTYQAARGHTPRCMVHVIQISGGALLIILASIAYRITHRHNNKSAPAAGKSDEG